VTAASTGTGADPEEVVLTVPATSSYVGTVRLASASLAARCDLTIDEIEDVRLAIDEVCNLLLPLTRPATTLQVRYSLCPGWLSATVAVHAVESAQPDTDSIGWALLQALTDTVEIESQDELLQATVTKRRQTSMP
jgi:serine/threonine-protein kinase RsbW